MSAEKVRRVCDGEELVRCEEEDAVAWALAITSTDPRAGTVERRHRALSSYPADGVVQRPAVGSERSQ